MSDKFDPRIQIILSDDESIAQFKQVLDRTGLSRSAAGAMLIRFGLDFFLSNFTNIRKVQPSVEEPAEVSA